MAQTGKITTKGSYVWFGYSGEVETFTAPYSGLYKVVVAGGRNGAINVNGSVKVSIACRDKNGLGSLYDHHHEGTFDATVNREPAQKARGYVVLKKGDKLYVNVGGDGGDSTYGARNGDRESPPTVTKVGEAGYNGGCAGESKFIEDGISSSIYWDHSPRSSNYKLCAASGGTTVVKTSSSSIVVSASGRSDAYVRYGLARSGDSYSISPDSYKGKSGLGFTNNKTVVYKNKSYTYDESDEYVYSDIESLFFPLTFGWTGEPIALIQLVDRDFPIYCGDSEIYKVCLGDSEIIDLKL